ncbi:DGQHR domain-containing protein [Polaromonas sp. LjRoot131]|uniref:DGQHR domain-containing protein n=1 Tax=Polaromonas sp. LjRoot131 TaxID=3342262 RepID=UPI003ECF840C
MNSRIDESAVEFSVNAISVTQPIGEFLIASMPAKRLCEITYFDVRRMLKERDIETYLGIQRPLIQSRVDELQRYVRTVDACFPTAVILAISSTCAEFDPNTNRLTLRNNPNPDGDVDPTYYRNIAKVLDGQHRIAGLLDYPGDDFEVNVSIFIDIDLEDQAYIFSTVNLAQTKVNKSLAYDLSELTKAHSPQKTCHNIAVALDQIEASPLFHRIKRLGTATPGRTMELLTQATFVESLMPFISGTPTTDRDVLKRGGKLTPPGPGEIQKHPLRTHFVAGDDLKIGDILFRYFSAVKDRWPGAWNTDERGAILNRTNGFRALMRALKPISKQLEAHKRIPTKAEFDSLLKKVSIEDGDFTIENFKPGTSGESQLYSRLIADMGLENQRRLI